ncbi:uncharacterized protein LOC118440207 isoform X2 [Vespa mandarinia]|uniref:uncharacterized protein LOC118440207 isoform X2 n=1 Tax=Vespa mandarinia TaxID=7446 RepID=UPI0016227283|nr:uncharacterized protein LOC118440207 isoform X2 [Vespa mandarinia]
MLTRTNIHMQLQTSLMKRINTLMTGNIRATKRSEVKKEESERMKQFHEKLKLEPIPRVQPGERFVDLVLTETDPETGELITDSEKEPTKWGDWQIGGREPF